MGDFKFSIKRHLTVLSRTKRGWSKEVNIVSWNDGPYKFDIREWSPDKHNMAKGVSLSRTELKALQDVMAGLDLMLVDPPAGSGQNGQQQMQNQSRGMNVQNHQNIQGAYPEPETYALQQRPQSQQANGPAPYQALSSAGSTPETAAAPQENTASQEQSDIKTESTAACEAEDSGCCNAPETELENVSTF